RLRSFPETLSDPGGFVGVADAVEVLGVEQPDLGERFEYRALAVEQREAHAWQLLPLALQQGVHGGEIRVELLALLHRAAHYRREQAVDGFLGARRAFGRGFRERHDGHAELAQEA